MACKLLARALFSCLCLFGAVRCATLRPVVESGTLKCNLQNRDPCSNFPDLCSTVGGTCVVKGPCQYECVCASKPGGDCSPHPAPATGVKVTDTRPAETESLLVFSPGLFWDLNHVDSRGELVRPSQQTTPPATTMTTTLKTTAAPTTSTSTTTTTTTPTTTSTTTTQPEATAASLQQMTTAEDAITTNDEAFTATSTDDQTLTTESPGNDDVTQTQGDTTLADVTTLDAVDGENASNTASLPSSSPFIASLYPTPATVKSRDQTPAVTSSSPSNDIHDILEKIKTSFELLTSHILASENANATGKSQASDTSGQHPTTTTGLTGQVDKLSSNTSVDQGQRETTRSTVSHDVTKTPVNV